MVNVQSRIDYDITSNRSTSARFHFCLFSISLGTLTWLSGLSSIVPAISICRVSHLAAEPSLIQWGFILNRTVAIWYSVKLVTGRKTMKCTTDWDCPGQFTVPSSGPYKIYRCQYPRLKQCVGNLNGWLTVTVYWRLSSSWKSIFSISFLSSMLIFTQTDLVAWIALESGCSSIENEDQTWVPTS